MIMPKNQIIYGSLIMRAKVTYIQPGILFLWIFHTRFKRLYCEQTFRLCEALLQNSSHRLTAVKLFINLANQALQPTGGKSVRRAAELLSQSPFFTPGGYEIRDVSIGGLEWKIN
ncbi:MAG: hypothetical protein AUK25_07335 [Desulfobacteraceae bacterium CG2_30_51_40]|nr:MAG: hypothetical protein AUK25_07335 [Desulfobacteraceae bacterium CG2_30_51_40]